MANFAMPSYTFLKTKLSYYDNNEGLVLQVGQYGFERSLSTRLLMKIEEEKVTL